MGRHRAQRADRLRADLLPRAERPARADEHDPPGDGRRLRAQFGGQRQDLREDAVQRGLRPARGRRRRHQHRRGVLRRARGAARRAPVRACEHAYTGPSSRTPQIQAAIEGARGSGWDPSIDVVRLEDAALVPRRRQGRGRRPSRWLVPGGNGVRPAGARQSFDRCRSRAGPT